MKILGIICLALLLILAGCSQENSTVNTEKQKQNTDSVTSKTPETQTEKQPTKTETPTTPKVEGKSLKDILSVAVPKYTVDYSLTAGSNPVQTMTIALDLPKLATIIKTTQGDAKVIFDGNTVNSCNNMAGSWTCFKMDVPKPANTQMESGIKDGSVISTLIGTCTQAGETGNKYEVNYNKSTSKVCYTNDGILLEMATPQSNMIATKVLRTVDSSVFQLPAAAQDISNMIPSGIKYP
jgi:hypothetical protein